MDIKDKKRIDAKIKKYILINRELCIGCGSCVAASEGKCKFIDGLAWASKIEMENYEEIIDVCPVECISAGTAEEYDALKIKFEIEDED